MNIKRILLEIDPWNIVFGKLQKVYRLECILTEILQTLDLPISKNFFSMIDYNKLQDMLDAEEVKILQSYDKNTKILNHQQQIKMNHIATCFQISNLICAYVNYQMRLTRRRNSLFFLLIISIFQPLLSSLFVMDIPIIFGGFLIDFYSRNVIAKNKTNVNFHEFSLKNRLEYAKKLQDKPLTYAHYKIDWMEMPKCKFNCYELHAYSQIIKYPKEPIPIENEVLGQTISQNRIFRPKIS